MANFPFLRADLDSLRAYTPHPGGPVTQPLDHLDTNEFPWDLPVALRETLMGRYREAVENNRYPDGSHHELKMAIANYVGQTANGQITADQISVGNGSDELIRSLLIATCVGEDGAILVANPTFSMYGILAQTLGVPVVAVDRQETDFQLDLTQAQDAIAQHPIRVVFMVHPNSPTGNALNASEIQWLQSLPEDILVVIDEAYFEFSQDSLVTHLEAHPNWLILRTFSKAFRLAAHRVGYAIAHPRVIQALEKIRLPYNLPSFTQQAALLALAERELLLKDLPLIWEERQKLGEFFGNLPHFQLWPTVANFLYGRVTAASDRQKNQATMEKLTADLKAQGTLIRCTGGGLRITVGTPEENQRTMARFQKQWPPTTP